MSLSPNNYRVLVRPRRRTMALVVRDNGDVEVLCPPGVSRGSIDSLIARKADWIAAKLADVDRARSIWPEFSVDPGAWVPFLGEKLGVAVVAGKGPVRRVGDTLVVQLARKGSGGSVTAGGRELVVRWLRDQAERALPARLEAHATRTQLRPASVAVRDYRRRWGSCFRDGRIALNWRLIMMPPEIVDYVLIHELCHLVHHDHSRAFYHLLGNHEPNWREYRRILHTTGRFLPL